MAKSLTFILLSGFLLSCAGANLNKKDAPVLSFKAVWVKSTNISNDHTFRKNNRMSTLLVGDSVVQANALDGVSKYNKNSGKRDWHFPVQGGVEGDIANIRDRLFFGGNDGQFYSISLSTGALVWSFPTRAENLSAPLLHEGVIYFLTGNNVLYALEADSGRQKWIYSRVDANQFSIRGGARPSIKGDSLIIGFSDGYLMSLHAQTGSIKWDRALNRHLKFKDLDSTPLIIGNNVFVLGYDDQIYSLNIESGKTNWSSKPGGYGSILYLNEKLYYSSTDGELIAMSPKNGSIYWKTKFDGGITTEPRSYKNFLLVGASGGKLYLLNQSDGNIVSTFEPGRGLMSPIMVEESSGHIYFISNEANFYKLRIESQDSRWGIPWLR